MVRDSGGSCTVTVELLQPYFHFISLTFNIMSPFFCNSIFILVYYTILKLNLSRHPLVHEKITKFLVSNYAPHSSCDMLFHYCAYVHMFEVRICMLRRESTVTQAVPTTLFCKCKVVFVFDAVCVVLQKYVP